ncbi:MAG: Nif3-like dinuclear metal center hexameric protein [Gemmatimonadetes bacterium]|nr:Nif3-like dinuclear metal center hexameric protein [Gemmatimonadota bacterium]
MRLAELVDYLDQYLRIRDTPDEPGAVNGLQFENAGELTRVGAAVDASEATIREAASRGCDLLLVHHGLYWDPQRAVTGRRYRKVRTLLEHDIAVYSAHVPLDIHAEVGNNVVLARELGLELRGAFGGYHGIELGVWGTLELRREALAARLDELLGGPVRLLPGGPERTRRVGVITGGAGSMIRDALAAGLDAYVTGEGAHWTYFEAMESGINVYYGGHYATETWGVRALAAHVSAKFGLAWEFLDFPTGL